MDIHNCSKALKNTYNSIKKNKKCRNCSFSDKTDIESCKECGEELEYVFPEEHRELAEKFLRKLKIRDMSDSRRMTYLSKLKQIMKHNPEKDLRNIDQKDVEDIIIQIKESAYYHKEYKEETKGEYRKTLKRLLEVQEEVDLLPKDFKATSDRSKVEYKDPSQLPKPRQHIRDIVQKIESKSRRETRQRNVAATMLMWDSGSRIGEIANIKMKGVTVKDRTVKLEIPGNKQSHDRTIVSHIAAPALKNYVENSHPNPDDPESYLFVKHWSPGKGERVQHRSLYNPIKNAGDALNLQVCYNPHVFRNARITYLDARPDLGSGAIKKRVGLSPNSEVFQRYSAVSDKQANQGYREAYGITQEEEHQFEKDLKPLKCSSCRQVNSGHRNSCRACGSILEEQAYPEGVENQKEKQLKQEKKTEFFRKLLTSNTSAEDGELEELAEETIGDKSPI